MDFTPLGFVYILLIGVILIFRRDLFFSMFLLYLVSSVFLRMGYVFSFGNTFVDFEGITLFILVVYSLVCYAAPRKSVSRWWILLVCSYIIPIVLLTIIPSDILVAGFGNMWDLVLAGSASLSHPKITNFVLGTSLKYILTTFIVLYIYRHWKSNDYKQLVSRFVLIAKLFLILGVIELLAKNIFHYNAEWGEMLLWMFGERESTIYEGRMRGNTYELNLFTLEASHYAYILFVICIAFMANNIMTKKKRIVDMFVIVAVLLMLMSTSFSVAYILPSLILFYLLYRWYVAVPSSATFEKVVVIGCIIIISLSASSILAAQSDGFVERRFINFVENFSGFTDTEVSFGAQLGDGSTQVRMIATIQALMAFSHRPIFGYSLMTVHSHSALPTYLAGVGIFGLICWIVFYFYKTPLYKYLHPIKSVYILAIIILLITNLLGGDRHIFSGAILILIVICFNYIYSGKQHVDVRIKKQ